MFEMKGPRLEVRFAIGADENNQRTINIEGVQVMTDGNGVEQPAQLPAPACIMALLDAMAIVLAAKMQGVPMEEKPKIQMARIHDVPPVIN